jgi:hypothetical protein
VDLLRAFVLVACLLETSRGFERCPASWVQTVSRRADMIGLDPTTSADDIFVCRMTLETPGSRGNRP